MLDIANAYQLDYLQLHGNESPEHLLCAAKTGIGRNKGILHSRCERSGGNKRVRRVVRTTSCSIPNVKAMAVQDNHLIGAYFRPTQAKHLSYSVAVSVLKVY